MAQASAEFLLENLKQLLPYHVQLIRDAKADVETLENDLRMLKAILEDCSTQKRNKYESQRQLGWQIRDVCYDAEDAIDYFATQAAEIKAKNYFARAINGRGKLHRVAKSLKAIRAKVKEIYMMNRTYFATWHIDGPSDTGAAEETFERIEFQHPLVRGDNVVGFNDEADTIINYLNEETDELAVICIIGRPGIGKTTLAAKIFNCPEIRYEFPIRIWVYVSRELNNKDVFLAILRNFTRVNELGQKSVHEIAEILYAYLERGKFLIVMDDVWNAEAWTDLQYAFPKSNDRGKILITSRNEKVAQQANKTHNLRLLTKDEGLLLLQLEVFGKPECPDDLITFGKLIVDRCGRLPLAIVRIAGILVKKTLYGDIGAMKKAWREISERTATYLGISEMLIENTLSLSYNNLPYYLRPCFLYLGMFPEDFEIPVQKLIRLWIAEGFIQQNAGTSLEQTAQDYLEDLINRNLVKERKVSPDGKIKTCRIHDMLRQFCKNEAGSEKEKFFQEVETAEGEVFTTPMTEIGKLPRLCIHSNLMGFISSRPYGPHIRSFLCFSKEEIALQRENISFIPAAFKLLRVLEAMPFSFQRFPRDLTRLVHLRYITLSINFKVLPEAISKLRNLQTLIVYTSSCVLEIKAEIWKMVQLRHVKTNASTILPKPSKSSGECENLQTLGTISPQSCTEDVFDRVRTIRKLSIRGQLAKLLDAKGLEKLDNLEKLRLVNEANEGPASEGQLLGLPQPYKFPPNLRSLTLCATFLDWHNMSTLGMLDTLEVLKLKRDAFVGDYWEATGGGFRSLQVLLIESPDLVTWVASAHHFPRLRCLVLRNCKKLQEIPSGLGQSLQKLYLKSVSDSAADSARKIQEQKRGSETSKRGGFKLIFDHAVE